MIRCRTSFALSIIALLVGLSGVGGAIAQKAGLITGAQIKNGTVRSIDLRNGGVRSPDLLNGTVRSPDIGRDQVIRSTIAPDAVTVEQIELPPAVQVTRGFAEAPVVKGEYSPLQQLVTLEKSSAETELRIDITGAVTSGDETNCVFQIRINRAPPPGGGGEAFAAPGPAPLGVSGLSVAGLPAGPLSVELWAKATSETGAQTCIVAPPNPGIQTTVTVTEEPV